MGEISFGVIFGFLGKFILILALIYLAVVLTPKAAAKIDSIAAKKKKTKAPEDERLYSVRSAFEPRPDDKKPDRTFYPELKNRDESDKK
ncbi:MAG: hypothetical protein Q4F95_12490 [Oscillospiraceae bacterium]|nr:hypothetical protein [Oscillospiraceae bacterium]